MPRRRSGQERIHPDPDRVELLRKVRENRRPFSAPGAEMLWVTVLYLFPKAVAGGNNLSRGMSQEVLQ